MDTKEMEVLDKVKVHFKSCPNCESLEIHLELNDEIALYYMHCRKCGLSGPNNSKQLRTVHYWNDLPRR